MTTVDIHCHTFNGDDLPVDGFVRRVLLDNAATLRVVAWALDKLGQEGTPGYEEERATLDRLLGAPTSGLMTAAFVAEPDVDETVDALIAELRTEDPALLLESEREMAAQEVEDQPSAPTLSPFGALNGARRAIAWAVLLRRLRLDITRRLIGLYPEVDLFCPMTVDMAVGLKDVPQVPPIQQVELHEKLSRLSMLGRLVDGGSAHVHPFIGFDPRSEHRSRRVGDITSPLDVVEDAVTRFGFVGVKLYPPTGFRPTDNHETRDMTSEEARAVDGILDELYSWCEQNDVPITAHCGASNEASSEYRLFSAPELWGRVLDAHGDLRLNLGHFGGSRTSDNPDDPSSSWPQQIARLASAHPHLFADSGNHRVDDERIATAYFEQLRTMFEAADTAAMRDRIMYGSDWLMLALLPRADRFLTTYRELFTDAFGAPAADRFMGGAALDFLGFSTPGNKNRERLITRYQKYEVAPPTWLTDR